MTGRREFAERSRAVLLGYTKQEQTDLTTEQVKILGKLVRKEFK